MKPADLTEWAVISKLLDEALDLPVTERAAWLERLPPEHAYLKPHLAELLAASALSDTSLPAIPQYTAAPDASKDGAFTAGQLIGSFRLIRPIGEGGMGKVWLAETESSAVKLPVALKLPRMGTLTTAAYLRERFERERVILGALNHPNIARLHEAGVTPEGQPFLALEYINGETLTSHCNKEKLPIKDRLGLFVQILKALQYAHANLIIHRDLKPSNILVTQTGEVKLLDFGIAKLLDTESQVANETELTQLGGRAMTPDYASPEQIRGESLTTASDVYSSGVLLYELLTGKRPYKLKRGSRAELEEAILTSDVSRPSNMVGDDFATETNNSTNRLKRTLAGDLDTIVIKALKKKADERYTSAQALRNDIERYLNGQPVLAQADSAAYRLKKFLARNRLVAAATASVFVALTAGLGIAIWHASAAKEQARIATVQAARAEKHFASVRKLANTFMFEIQNELEGVPGTLKARELLVTTTVAYLDALAMESNNDPDLIAELAAAYRKVANVQGQPGAGNTGKLSDSIANFEKGKQLYLSLGEYKKNDIAAQRDHLSLSYALSRAYVQNGDPRWRESIATTVKLANHVAALPDAVPRDHARAASALAEQAYLTSIQIGQSAAAEAEIEKAISRLETLLRENPDGKGIRSNLAQTYIRAGEIYSGNQRTRTSLLRAIEVQKKGIDHFLRLAAEAPTNRHDLSVAIEGQVKLADSLSLTGQSTESTETINAALAQYAALVKEDPQNGHFRLNQFSALQAAQRIAFRQGAIAQSIRYGRDLLSRYANFSDEHQKFRETRSNLADAKAYLGRALLSERGLQSGTKLREVCTLLSEALDFMNEVRASKQGVIHHDEIKTTEDNLTQCKAELASSPSR